MKLLAFTIGGGTSGGPGFSLSFPGQIPQLSGNFSLQTLLVFIINLLLTVAILLAFFFVLIGGIRWILSQGDKKQLETAQKTILYAIIGLVVVLLSFFIINLIGFLFGVSGTGLLNP